MFRMTKRYEVTPRGISKNKLMYTNGIHFVYGRPASGKTTLALSTILSMDKKFYFVDYDSKDLQNINDIYDSLSKDEDNVYSPYLIYKHDNDGKSRVDLFKEVLLGADKDSAILVDTFHYLVKDENDNNEAKRLLDEVLEIVQLKNLLLVFIGHVSKQTNSVRGASSLLSNASCGLLVEKNDDRMSITVSKDSHGQLQDCNAVVVSYKGSIAETSIIYDNEEVEEEMNKEQMKLLLFTQKTITILYRDFKVEIGSTDFKNHVKNNINKFSATGGSLPKIGSANYFGGTYVNKHISDIVNDYCDTVNKGRSIFIQPIGDIQAWEKRYDIWLNIGEDDG